MDGDTLFGYITSTLVILGGLMGYAKRGSVASLIAGGGTGSVLAYGVYLQTQDRKKVIVIIVASIVLLGVMGPKFARTGKVMPSGLVTLLSLAMLVRFGSRLL